jgi:hypothetical protein
MPNDDIMGYNKDHVTGSTNQEIVQVASGMSDDTPHYTKIFPKSAVSLGECAWLISGKTFLTPT